MARKRSSSRYIFPEPAGPGRWLGPIFGFLFVLLVGGLGVAYALTPLHDTIGHLTSLGNEGAFIATPMARAAKKVGADTHSVVDPSQKAVPTPVPVPTASAEDSRFAFLLMGYGGGGHDGAYLTDSMMVVVVDAERKTLTILSVPRDSWVPMSMNGKTTEYNKINTAYAFAKDPTLYPDRLPRYAGDQGAGNFASDTVSRVVGIPVRYYLALDFQGFRDMIDAVGGVDVDVPDNFSARYPANDDPSVDASWKTVKFTQGHEHMSGERAIEFARARETLDNPDEGTDFARSRRQRIVMEAFKARLFQPGGMIHLPQLLAIASKHVDTNYTIPDVAKLTQLALGWKDVTFYQTALTALNYLDEGTGPEGTYVLFPDAPNHSWVQIRAFARRLWSDPATATAMADTTIVVENGSGVSGAAGRVSDSLMKLGYRVGDPITAPHRPTTELIDKSGGKLKPVIQQLTKDLDLPDLQVTEDGSDPMPVLILMIGSDKSNLTVDVPEDTAAPWSALGVQKSAAPAAPAAPPATSTATSAPARSPVRPPTVTETPKPEPTKAEPAKPSPTLTPVPTKSRLPASPTPKPPTTRQSQA